MRRISSAPPASATTRVIANPSFCFAAATALVLYCVRSVGIRNLAGILPLTATALEALLHRKLLPLFAVAWLCYVPFYMQQTAVGRWIAEFVERRARFAVAAMNRVIVPFAPRAHNAVLEAQQRLRRGTAEAEDDVRIDQRNLALDEGQARRGLLWRRRAITRWCKASC